MKCEGCGNANAMRLSYSKHGESCNACGDPCKFRFSDVYFKGGYFDEHIAHDTKSPFGSEVRSREHKAALMKEYGLRERGDKIHGARDNY